jgi:uncharacterized membrane protein YdfJ with MMPL/SSD domain
VLTWVAALLAAFVLSGSFSGPFSADYSAPGSDSSAAQELLEQHFAGSDSVAATFVVQAPGSVDSPTARAQIAALRTRIAGVPHVSHVGDPHSSTGVRSANGTAVLFDAVLDVDDPEQMPVRDAEALIDAASAASTDGFDVGVGGDVILLAEAGAIGSEGIGLAAAAVVLLLTFGSVIAAGLPILIAIVGLAASVLLTTLLAAALPVPDWSTSLVAMMVLGVGIDYTLLMVTRFREWRGHGLSAEDATVATLDTAGRSVLLAGTTVVVSMAGLAGIGLSFMRGAAVVTIVGVLAVLAATMTLFPRAARLLRLAHRQPAGAAAAPTPRGAGRRLVALEPARPALPLPRCRCRPGRHGSLRRAVPRRPARDSGRRQQPRRHLRPRRTRPDSAGVRSRRQRPPASRRGPRHCRQHGERHRIARQRRRHRLDRSCRSQR